MIWSLNRQALFSVDCLDCDKDEDAKLGSPIFCVDILSSSAVVG